MSIYDTFLVKSDIIDIFGKPPICRIFTQIRILGGSGGPRRGRRAPGGPRRGTGGLETPLEGVERGSF